MKKEYDFSKGVRGKFHNPDGEFNLPIYLEPDDMRRITRDDAMYEDDAGLVETAGLVKNI